MTKKDYIKIARALNFAFNVADYQQSAHDEGVRDAANAVADVMQEDNPNFDRAKFLKAAGVKE